MIWYILPDSCSLELLKGAEHYASRFLSGYGGRLYAVIVCIRYVWYDKMYLVVFVLSLGTIVYTDLWMRSGNYKEKTEVIQ